MAKLIVSACLLGCQCRYKGDGCKCDALVELAKTHTLIPVCPEQLGGLATPRDPAEIVGERVISNHGRDVTEQYQRGAETALYLARLNHADAAVLKANSPSCGKDQIYDGTFTGRKIPGSGVTAALLKNAGFAVFTENELEELKNFLENR